MKRRTWMKLLAAVAAAPGVAQQEAPPRISKEALQQALKLVGLEFSDAEQTALVPRVNRALAQFEALRKMEIPPETEPAFRFTPLLPGRSLRNGPARFHATRVAAPKRPYWKSLEELAFLPVTELAPLVRARLVASRELTEMYLGRLKKYAPKLNCVVTTTAELALQQADAADRDIRAGRYRGPLHGIPWGAKDLFATKGIRTTWGAEPYQNQVFDYDATVVERLEKAGAVLLAKLSMGALAAGGNWFGGMTRTPWNPEQSSSGSSAGPAAATAAGLVGFSVGTETMGSIVTPSVRCGVVGLRPTYGRVSRYGGMTLSWTMDKVGPICRSVEDCALVLEAIHGPDGRDPTVPQTPFDWEPKLGLERLRMAIIQKDFEGFKGEEKTVYDKALEDLKKAGARLETVELPEFPANSIGGLSVEAAAAFDDLTRDGRVNEIKNSGWPVSFRAARLVPAVEYIRSQRARTLLMRAMDRLMSQWDVLVGATGQGGRSLGITNLTGHPQVVVPCGFIKGMPRGLLFTGRLYEEGAMLRAALAFEQATAWHKMHPKVDWA